jgi:hypothetical protein
MSYKKMRNFLGVNISSNLLTLILTSISQVSFGQKNFTGEIDFKKFIISDVKKDTTFGEQLKFFFGENIIKMESLTDKGNLLESRIILIDSLKEIVIDHRFKTISIQSETNAQKLSLPWGMNKVSNFKKGQNISGYETYLIHLSNVDRVNYGYIDLNAAKILNYKIKSTIPRSLFIEGLLFFDDHIVLSIKIVAGQAPHTQRNYVATGIYPKVIDSEEFELPKTYQMVKN